MKKVLCVFLLTGLLPFSALSEAPTPTLPTRVNSKRWNTYVNQTYGFSVQYLWGIDDFLPKPDPHDFGVTVITLPTINDKGPIFLTTFTDKSIEKSDKSIRSDQTGENDGELFKYSIKGLNEDLKLPVGSECKVTKNGKVVSFNGVKAILLIPDQPNAEIEKKYFVPRGETRWLEIDVKSFDNKKNPFLKEVLTPELRKRKEMAVGVVLKTFKFFEPKEKSLK